MATGDRDSKSGKAPASGADSSAESIAKYLIESHVEPGEEITTVDGFRASSVLHKADIARYEVGEEIGHGAMGVVLKVRDRNIRRTVALKSMLTPEAATKQQTLRFIEEAQIAGQLEHSAIVPVYELGVAEDGRVFYTMKHVRGATLRSILDEIRKCRASAVRDFPLMRLLTIFQRVCDAAAFAHAHGVVHRDLKPENIMVEDFGEVYVMDWGLAKLVGPGASSPESFNRRLTRQEQQRVRERIESVREDVVGGKILTLSEDIMGTPPFMAPEQIGGDAESVGFHTDIYALGATLFNTLTLRAPLEGEQVRNMLWKTIQGKIEPATASNPPATKSGIWTAWRRTGSSGAGKQESQVLWHLPNHRIPESLSAVAMKAMALNPRDRYPSVVALQKDIEAYTSGFVTSAEQAGVCRQALLLVRRNRVAFLVAATTLLVLAGVARTGYQRLTQSRKQALAAQAQWREAAPAFRDQVRLLIALGKTDDALTRLRHAMELFPGDLELHAMQGDIHQVGMQFSEAIRAYDATLKLKPGYVHALDNLKISHTWLRERQDQGRAEGMLMADMREEFIRQQRFAEAECVQRRLALLPGKGWSLDSKLFPLGMVIRDEPPSSETPGLAVSLATCQDPHTVDDVSALRSLPLRRLDLAGTAVSNLWPLQGLPLEELSLKQTPVEDLLPLRGMPLKRLYLDGTRVTRLQALEGMPLDVLSLGNCPVTDLSPLRDLKLRELILAGTRVSDLDPLKGDSLQRLDLTNCRSIMEFSALTEVAKLRQLWLPAQTLAIDLRFLRRLADLEELWLNGSPLIGADNRTGFWRGVESAYAAMQADPQSPAMHWTFDEGGADGILDQSGNRFMAKDFGSVTIADGRLGRALALDGRSHLQVNGSNLLNATSLTICAWVKPERVNARRPIVAKRNRRVDAPYIFGLNNGFLRFEGCGEGKADWTHNVDGPAVPPHAWAHVAVTVEAGRQVTMYMNGVEVAHRPIGEAPRPNAEPIVIGCDVWGGDGFYDRPASFDGLIDELKFWRRALSPSEVAAESR
ncbi:MAG: hypothetical protein A3K19_00795 [Lentisphaerae bacterium RIFOXYB12_FULL_65_16]|nr:MAG: hypothetical protein A3K18_14310 [Lentisphaerae bacterium RIFOXYA12_64_32]OGV86758.1 MAG: hypothetical protein A3K19_00795 [Lentisphaerae bacterium RIFOXYB12_FULL_65_16]